MMQNVIILDTSVLCCWLQVPGKDTAGSGQDKWDFDRIDSTIKEKIDNGYYIVLPLATILETGNHISQASKFRFECAEKMSKMLEWTAQGDEPWAAFTEQAHLFTLENMTRISKEWPVLAAGQISLGDFLIVDVANYYAAAGIKVEILTGDAGLKAYEPVLPVKQPRRRSKHR